MATWMKHRRGLLFLTVLATAVGTLWWTPAFSEEDVNEDPLTAQLALKPDQLPAGANGVVEFQLSLPKGFKAYVDQFRLTWKNPEGGKVGAPRVTPTFKFEDKFSKKVREGLKDSGVLTANFEIPPTMAAGDYKVEIDLTYQACTDNYCLFPSTKTYTSQIKVLPGDGSTISANDSTVVETGDSFQQKLKGNLFVALIAIFFAGLVTSLTPCIFPMIPITLAVIGARSAERGRLKNFSVSLSYVLGIAVTYSLLGLLAAKTGAMFGAALGNPYVVTAIAVLFVAMGLSMYGVFEFRMPAFLTQSLGATKTQSGYFGAFVTGLITGLVASPCVGPILVTILTFVAESQNMVLGFLFLFTYAMGMGQIFLVLGTFSGLIQKLPKSGTWMEAVKFVLGTTMIGAALYYLEPVTPTRIYDSFIALALVLISGAYGAFTPAEQLTNTKKKLVKAFMLASFLVGVAFAIKSSFGSIYSGGPVAPSEGGGPAVKLDWKPYSDEKLQEALTSGKPVIIDFWADWCAACKELELLTFTHPQVREESLKFVLLKIDATRDTEEIRRLKKQYRVIGLPTLIFFDSKGKLRGDIVLTGFETGTKFLERMKKASN